MPIPIFLILFVIFIIVFTIRLKKSNKEIKSINKAYWEQEEQSLFVRKKNIDDLDYITISPNELPTDSHNHPDIAWIQDKILTLLPQKMISFNGKTNTELRLEYGTANFTTLSIFEERYNLFIKLLYKWGKLLVELHHQEEALLVLEVGLRVHTDISKHYILLATIYSEKQDMHNFKRIYDFVGASDFMLKDKILATLDAM